MSEMKTDVVNTESNTKKVIIGVLLALLIVYLFFAFLYYSLSVSVNTFYDFSLYNTPPDAVAFLYVIPVFIGIPLFLLRYFVKTLLPKVIIPEGAIVLMIIVLVLISGYSTFGQIYNYFNGQSNRIELDYANLDVYYQKRFDLIPNLAKSAVALSDTEKEIVASISNARAGYSASTSSEDKIKYSNQLDNVLYKSVVNIENYPNLKSDQGYLALIDSLKTTESEIADARLRYNDSVEQYNRYAQSFPYTFILNSMDIERKKAYYESPDKEDFLKADQLLNILDK